VLKQLVHFMKPSRDCHREAYPFPSRPFDVARLREQHIAQQIFPDYLISACPFPGLSGTRMCECDLFDSRDAVTGKRWVHLDDGSVMSVSNHE